MIYKVIICGDREYNSDYGKPIVRTIMQLAKKHGTKDLLIIEGGQTGVDSMVKKAAQARNIHVAEIEALWNVRGLNAGPQRNRMMAALQPNEVIAIHEDIEKSRGTAGMIKVAEELGIPWKLVSP